MHSDFGKMESGINARLIDFLKTGQLNLKSEELSLESSSGVPRL
jgi:hypothetical protein